MAVYVAFINKFASILFTNFHKLPICKFLFAMIMLNKHKPLLYNYCFLLTHQEIMRYSFIHIFRYLKKMNRYVYISFMFESVFIFIMKFP